uniref:Uncharacterized protein n=1 Tax=Caenorhabditis japonica TaxID=281687 RepID=A0A8R1DYA2_CAEJA
MKFNGSGHIFAGDYSKQLREVAREFREAGCYHQNDWALCLCFFDYCNSPQYWTLMLSRTLNNHIVKSRHPSVIMAADDVNYKKSLSIALKRDVKRYDQQLRCLIWYADSAGQEEYDAPFYLYNYITTRYDSPSLVDALKTPPKLKRSSGLDTQPVNYFINEPEPFADNFDSTETWQRRLEQFDRSYAILDLIVGVIFGIIFVIFLVLTCCVLNKLCGRLQDQSLFIRSTDKKVLVRFENLMCPKTVPKQYERVKRKGLPKAIKRGNVEKKGKGKVVKKVKESNED